MPVGLKVRHKGYGLSGTRGAGAARVARLNQQTQGAAFRIGTTRHHEGSARGLWNPPANRGGN